MHRAILFIFSMQSRAYSAAGEEDLFDALEAAIQEDALQLPTTFPNIMSSWTRQKGFPALNVERDYLGSTVTISQQRYLSNPSSAPDSTRWWIPLNFVSASSGDFDNTTATHWMSPITASQSITLSSLNASDWLLVNKMVCV